MTSSLYRPDFLVPGSKNRLRVRAEASGMSGYPSEYVDVAGSKVEAPEEPVVQVVAVSLSGFSLEWQVPLSLGDWDMYADGVAAILANNGDGGESVAEGGVDIDFSIFIEGKRPHYYYYYDGASSLHLL